MMPSEEITSASFSSRLSRSLSTIVSLYVDRTTVYVKTRWIAFCVMLILYGFRVWLAEGFYIVTYGLCIYLLNLFIGFLSPQIDPETEGYVLPVRDAEEYRPFQRRLPEFKFWLSAARAVLIAAVMSCFKVFNLPVFWPILLVYFIFLFVITMKQQIKHMIKHRYIPISWGKQTYGEITRHGNISRKAPAQSAASASVLQPSAVSGPKLSQTIHPTPNALHPHAYRQ